MSSEWPKPATASDPVDADYEEVKRRIKAFDPEEVVDDEIVARATPYLKYNGYLDNPPSVSMPGNRDHRSDTYFVYDVLKWDEYNM